jgi:hypothetical protein
LINVKEQIDPSEGFKLIENINFAIKIILSNKLYGGEVDVEGEPLNIENKKEIDGWLNTFSAGKKKPLDISIPLSELSPDPSPGKRMSR